MTVYLPNDPRPDRWWVGDIIMAQHGPDPSNIFMWRVTSVAPLTTECLVGSEYEKYRPSIDKHVAQVKGGTEAVHTHCIGTKCASCGEWQCEDDMATETECHPCWTAWQSEVYE